MVVSKMRKTWEDGNVHKPGRSIVALHHGMVGVLKTEGRRPGIQDERRPYIRHSFVSAMNSSHGTFQKAKVLSFDSSIFNARWGKKKIDHEERS